MKALCTLISPFVLVFGLSSCLGPSATKATSMGAAVGAATAGPVGAAAGGVAGNVYGGVRDRIGKKKQPVVPAAPAPPEAPAAVPVSVEANAAPAASVMVVP